MKKYIFIWIFLFVSLAIAQDPDPMEFPNGVKVGNVPEITGADSVLVMNGLQRMGYVPKADLEQTLSLNGSEITISGQNTIDIGPLVGANALWGNITGLLSDQTDLQDALDTKQDTLSSGVNIRTINGLDILGPGNLIVSASGAENNDLTQSVTWTDVPDLNITESSVFQHRDAILDGIEDNATVGADWDVNLTNIPANLDLDGSGTNINAGTNTTVTGTGTIGDPYVINSSGSGTGDVTAASSFGADNRLIRSDGTGKGVQVTEISVDDSNNIDMGDNQITNANLLSAVTVLASDDVISQGGVTGVGLDISDNSNLGLTARLTPTDTEPISTEARFYWDDSENRMKAYDGTSWKAFLLEGDAAGTNSQTLSISGTDLSISNGNTVDLSGIGLSDGDKGDITVSSSGATWTLDDDVVEPGNLNISGSGSTGFVPAYSAPNTFAWVDPNTFDNQDAAEVSISDSGDNFTATDVEGALAELAGVSGGGLTPTDIGAANRTLTQSDFGKFNYSDESLYLGVDNSISIVSRAIFQTMAIDSFQVVTPDTGVTFVGNGHPSGPVYADSTIANGILKIANNRYSITPDYKPYSIAQATGVEASNIDENSFDIDVDEGTASVGDITDCECSIDGATPTSFVCADGLSVTGLTEDTTYNVNVRYVDKGGNKGPYSADLEVTTASSFVAYFPPNAMTPAPNEVNGVAGITSLSGSDITWQVIPSPTTDGAYAIEFTKNVAAGTGATAVITLQNMTPSQSYNFTFDVQVQDADGNVNNNYVWNSTGTGSVSSDWSDTFFREVGTGNTGNWETYTNDTTPAIANPRIAVTFSSDPNNNAGMKIILDNWRFE